ncbi:MAG: aminotransferase class I/II-fold pyridoxal phosphate-dependent enzyme, partial [Cyanobacteria bacterium P01_F01_bin.42]
YDGVQHCSPAQFDPGCEHTISLFSLSKAYGFAGWRIGYMVIPIALQIAIQKIQDTILICPALPSQVAAIAALEVGQSYARKKLINIAEVRALIKQRLLSVSAQCEYIEPQGAFYFWLKIATQRAAIDLVRTLIYDFKVAVIPGSAFGSEDDCYLRIAYGALALNTVEQGISRFTAGLQALVDG